MSTKKIRANSMVEFAIILPIFLLLLAGIIDISVITYNKAVITNASREGARYGIVYRSTAYATIAQIQAYTTTFVTGKLITFASTPGVVLVNVTQSNPTPAFGETLTVQVSYNYTDLLLHNFIGTSGTQTISATTTMTYE